MPAAEVPALSSWQLAAGEGGHISQVLSASQPCSLAEGVRGGGGERGGGACGRGSSGPKTGLTRLRNQVWETHAQGCAHEVQEGQLLVPTVTVPECLPNC